MSNDDLTSKRIASKWRSVIEDLAIAYQLRRTVKPDWLALCFAEEAALSEKLGRRPIGLADIEALFTNFKNKLLRAM